MLKIFIISIVLSCSICLSNLDAFQNNKQRKHKNRQKSDTSQVIKKEKSRACCTDSTANCDRFIDKDRDGINDNRCRGYGVCKHKNRHQRKNKSK